MVLASLRFGFLVTTVLASLHVTAAPHFWTLTGVRFDDGTVASGYFSYDDVTQTIAHWNVQVDKRLFFRFSAYTYVPGNSSPYTFQAPFGTPRSLGLSAPLGSPPGGDFGGRQLQITPLTPLDGSNATVPLITRALDGASFFISVETFGDGDDGRVITAGSLVLTPPPPVAIVQVDEFYNTVLRHYFLTASTAEKRDLDTGVHPGWTRTGESFKAYAPGSLADGSINPVCRYYGDPRRGLNSHFYSADGGECLQVFRKYGADWLFESDNVFQINLPDTATGACPGGTIPVYRLWYKPGDSNHRYTTSLAIKANMLAAGYVIEGYGPDGVVMCAVQ